MARHSRYEINPAYLIIVAILCVSSLVSCLWFFIEKTKLYQEFTQKINWLNQENAALSSKMEKVENEKINLAGQIKQLEDKIKEFSAEKNNFSNKLDSLLKENQNLSSQLQGLSEEKLALENKIKELERGAILADAQMALPDFSSVQATKDIRLDEIVQAKVKMEETLKAERQLTENLSQQIIEERKERLLAKAEKVEVEKKLSEAQKLQDSLRVQLSRLTLTNRSKELEAMSSALDQIPTSARGSSAVQLPPVIVRADQKIEWLPRKVPGAVISIDQEHNFVIISLGEVDGINQGEVFRIVREDKDIAEVKVIQTRRTISACDINKLEPGFNIEKDDQAVRLP